ncbi:MAG: biotin--[acetyl-CoA-carboxylase] ligase, partial [Hyphomicrobiales bacterium]
SPAGENLYFTLVLRVSNEAQKLLPVAVPLAVCEAIQRDAPDAAIKWPNDIWLGGRKLCGMLIDAESSPEGAVAYPGIGINVNGDPTLNPELRDIATSLRRELGREVEREELLARICNALEAALETPEPALVREYRARSLVLGQNVTVIPASGGGYGALAVGIAADGSLVVEHPNGSRETVTAAEVSLRPA